MAPMTRKPPIGGPAQGRPAKRKPPKKGRIEPIRLAPPGKEGRHYLGSLTKRVREMKRPVRNKPYTGPGRSKGM